jgi:hypothetical protein
MENNIKKVEENNRLFLQIDENFERKSNKSELFETK